MIAIGFSLDIELGVDIEWEQPYLEVLEIMKIFFPDEKLKP